MNDSTTYLIERTSLAIKDKAPNDCTISVSLSYELMASTSSTIVSPSKTTLHLSTSPIPPIQPLYPIDSLVDTVDEVNDGGIFLFETERHLVHTHKYISTLYGVCFFGCWICTIPSVVVTIFARVAAQRNQITRAKVLFNIAFMFSFFGLIFFAVQAGYLTWLARYFLHRWITQ